jgi:hypothetical protein
MYAKVEGCLVATIVKLRAMAQRCCSIQIAGESDMEKQASLGINAAH